MNISVVNHTSGKIKDKEVLEVIRAINRQVKEDFEPYWSLGATLRLEGRSQDQPDSMHTVDMRGDAVIYLWDKPGSNSKKPGKDPIGYHDQNFNGIPFGFVFTDVASKLGEPWSVALSHEVLEMIGDPELNLMVQGPDPRDPQNINKYVFHYYEMCDAVQTEAYEIDGVRVSNFVLPLYFTGGDEFDGRNDFLGTVRNGKTLTSFGVNPEGYICFFDPATRKHHFFFNEGDKVAERRLAMKKELQGTRRSVRYQRVSNPDLPCRLAEQEKRKPVAARN